MIRGSGKSQNLSLNRHSGKAQRDPESRFFMLPWLPAEVYLRQSGGGNNRRRLGLLPEPHNINHNWGITLPLVSIPKPRIVSKTQYCCCFRILKSETCLSNPHFWTAKVKGCTQSRPQSFQLPKFDSSPLCWKHYQSRRGWCSNMSLLNDS